jgi:uncharacterized protein
MKPIYLTALAFLFSIAGCSEQDPTAQQGRDAAKAAEPLAVGTPIETVVKAPPKAAAAAGDSAQSETLYQEMEWDSLIPEDYRPDKIMDKYDLDNISDDDPRAAQLQEELQKIWDQAPVREELDGKRIKLPGFVVPVETDEKESTGFLLVPYYGACIHVPPPPANQTVYVVTQHGKGIHPKVFDVVWVSGDLSVRRMANDVAEAGYTLYASDVQPYE